MTSLLRVLAGLLFVGAAPALAQQPAPAPQPEAAATVYMVSYIDVLIAAKAQTMALLRQFRAGCAREPGNLRCEAVQRMEQQNEFALLEAWKDEAAYRKHAAGSGAQLRERLKPWQQSPIDERVLAGVSVLPPQPAPPGRVVYALTHIDLVPPQADATLPALIRLAEESRRDQGNGRYEVLRESARANHVTLIEIWSNRRLLEAHQAQPHTIRARDKLQAALGSPYDERLYKVLD